MNDKANDIQEINAEWERIIRGRETEYVAGNGDRCCEGGFFGQPHDCRKGQPSDLQQARCPECGGNLADYAKFNGSIVNPHAPECSVAAKETLAAVDGIYLNGKHLWRNVDYTVSDGMIVLAESILTAPKPTIWERLQRWFA